MEITGLKVLNVQGLEGSHDFTGFGKINILCGPNGSGKTSFQNALRMGLCGSAGIPNLITEGQDSCAVCLTTKDGTSYTRQKYRDPKTASRFFVQQNGKAVKTTQTGIEGMLLGDIPRTSAKWAVSGDVLESFDQKKFGNFLMSYVPEELTVDSVCSYIDGITDASRAILSKVLKGRESFGITAVQKAYRELYSTRTEYNKKLEGAEGSIRSINAFPAVPETISDLEARKEELMGLVAAASAYEEKKKSYEKYLFAKKNAEEKILALTQKLEGFDTDKIKKAAAGKEKALKAYNDADTACREKTISYNNLLSLSENISRGLQGLSEQSFCPYSMHLKDIGKTIVCRTDMSPYIEELEKAAEKASAEAGKAKKELDKCTAKLEKARAKKEECEKAEKDLLAAESCEQQIAAFKKSIPEEVPMPEPPAKTAAEIRAELSLIDEKIGRIKARAELPKYEAYRAKLAAYLKELNLLVTALAPGGTVQTSIFASYTDSFEEICNEKASALKEGMKVRFVTENGIKVFLAPDGKRFLSYDQLSGGEKALLIYIILDMASQLTGMNVLIVDELSVLDDEVFESLVRLLCREQDSYDSIFIAAAQRKGIEDIIKKYGLHQILLTDGAARAS